jgi:hypothetical protein
MIPYDMMLGVLWYKKWYNAHGVGLYIQGGYKAEGNFTGEVSKPGDKDDPASKNEYFATFQRAELRHGPFLHMGGVF